MSDWKEYKLGDVANVKGGKRLPKGINLTTEVNKHPYIRVRDLGTKKTLELDSSYEYVDDETQKKIARYIVNEGDIIISIVGTIGLVAIIGSSLDNANLTENCVKLIDLKGIDKEFLYYYLISDKGKNEIEKGVVGAVQAKLPIKNIQAIKIKAPGINDQKRIASILSTIDSKIECNRRINENLEQQAQALFKSWFVDFEPFKDQPFVESELGMIPQGWKVITLSDACEKVTDGSHYSPKDHPFGTIPMLSVKDMTHNCFDYSSCKKINEEEYEKMKVNDCVPRVNDILVAKDGSYLKEIFMCNEEIKQAILSSIAIFRSNIDVIFPEILLQLLRLPKVKKDVGDNYVSGSALPRIVLKDFKKFKFVVAPIEIQNEIIESLRSVNARIHINEKESRRLAELRDTLLPKLMSGEINVNEVKK